LNHNVENEEAEWQRDHPELEVGEPRTLVWSSPTTSAPLVGPDGSPVGLIEICGAANSLIIRKNQLVSVVLNSVTLSIDPSAKWEAQPNPRLIEIPNIPTIDGAQPRSWDYGAELSFARDTCSILMRRNSVAMRSSSCKSPMPILADNEELAMSAPRNRVVLQTSAANPTASANIEARLLLRDFLG
jgi:hypothetical protein